MKIILKDKIDTEQPLLTVAMTENVIYYGGLSSIVYKYTFTGQNSDFLPFNNPIRAIATHNGYLICCSYKNAILMKDEKYIDIVEDIETEIKGVDINKMRIGIATRGCDVWLLDIKISNLTKINPKGESDLNSSDFDSLDMSTNDFDNNIFVKTPEQFENYSVVVKNILQDHTQDVKGIKFYQNLTFTYGYDCTIKIYDNELIESLNCEDTVWDVIFNEYIVACDNSGFLYYYDYDYTLIKKIKMSKYPIPQMCNVGECIAYVYNRQCIAFVDNFEIVEVFDVSKFAINSLKYNNENQFLACVDDGGSLHVYKIDTN